MNTFEFLFSGFAALMNPTTLFMCFIGAVLGTMVGVLPGFGPSAALAVLIPTIYGKDPLTSLVMLSGIFSGAMFGGMITSISLNIPGENAAVVTTFDGYPLAKQGHAGKAMGIAAISSFIGGTIGVIMLTLVGTPLARIALKFGPQEYFALYLFTFVAILSLGGGSFLKSAMSLVFGLLVTTIGLDVMAASSRLTFGSLNLMNGINFIPAVVGLFGLSEIILSISEDEKIDMSGVRDQKTYSVRNVFPKLSEFIHCIPTTLRGSLLGFCVGALPGAGATIATFMAYSIEKRISKNPEKFGKGEILGVASPESANNGAAIGSFVPLLSLGIPGSPTSAVLLGAFIMLGLQPGPRLFSNHPNIAWGLIASMYVGNVMLLIINTAFIPIFIWLLRISQSTMPVIVASLCVIGTYSVGNSLFDVLLMLIFTAVGIGFKKLKIPPAPAVIAIVLGSDLEFSLRQSLAIFRGDFTRMTERPIAMIAYAACLILLIVPLRRSIQSYRAKK
jgi:putative tricarboxylic transport membrane protein